MSTDIDIDLSLSHIIYILYICNIIDIYKSSRESQELGVQAPVGYWDPAGLAKDGDVETFKRRRGKVLYWKMMRYKPPIIILDIAT